MSKKFQKFLTPLGTAKFPALVVPDTKFNADGVYKTGLLMTAEDAEELSAKIIEVRDAFRKETMRDADKKRQAVLKKYSDREPTTEDIDEDGEETGLVCFNLTMKATVTKKDKTTFTQQPKIFDTENKDMRYDGLRIWGGSTLKAAGELVPYCMDSSKEFGVSLRLKAVQVHSLNEGGDSAEGYGFDTCDEGFKATPLPAELKVDNDSTADEEDF